MISGIILASGLSRRMGVEKLILPVDGIPIVERVIRSAVDSRLSEIIVIYKNEDVRKIAEKYGVKTIYNELSHLGQSEAVKLGVINSNPHTRGYMFFTGDQPFLDRDVINTLVDNFSGGQFPVVAPLYDGKRGNPVIFSSELRDKLLELNGDTGGKAVINGILERVRFVHINNSIAGMDIDTFDEYTRISKMELIKNE